MSVDTSFQPAASLPVQFTRPVGDRYFWRVRSCSASDACSTWTPVRYLEVGRLDSDFNGDGYADLLVGARGQRVSTSGEGGGFAYYGGAGGLPSTPSVSLVNPIGETNRSFGFSVASVGDINADGFSDAIVGAPTQAHPATGEGNAFIYLGSATGLSRAPDQELDCPENQERAQFGSMVTRLGDFNADGYADLAVGALHYDGTQDDEGAVFLYFGSSRGVPNSPSLTIGPRAGTLGFGEAIGGGDDLNGDGYPDLVIGAPGENMGVGSAFIYLGRNTPSGSADIIIPSPTGDAEARFGGVLSLGDLNGDGYSDLAAGSYAQSSPEESEGAAFVFFGGPGGVPTSPSVTLDNPTDEPGGLFGIYLSAGTDVDGDGHHDLLVGASGQDGHGSAFLFLGTATGLEPTPSFSLVAPDQQALARFADSVALLADANGDGYGEVVIGAPRYDAPENNEGQVFLYMGTVDGIPTSPTVTLDNPEDRVNGGFGWTFGS